jgi:hypothetical protein
MTGNIKQIFGAERQTHEWAIRGPRNIEEFDKCARCVFHRRVSHCRP